MCGYRFVTPISDNTTNSRYHINANHTEQHIEQTKKKSITWYFSSTANKANIGQAFNAHNNTDLNSDLGLRA